MLLPLTQHTRLYRTNRASFTPLLSYRRWDLPMHCILYFNDVTSTPQGLLKVGGLELVRRQARAARLAGATSLTGLSEHAQAYDAATRGDRVATMPMQWQAGQGQVDALRAVGAQSVLVISGQHIAQPAVLKTIGANSALANSEGEWVAARINPLLLNDARVRGVATLDALIARLVEIGAVATQTAHEAELVRVTDQASARRAHALLFKTLRKPMGRQTDGWTAYFINRPISLTCSRALVHTPITPNMITGFNIALGIVGGAMIWGGSVWGVILGALIMQIVSIMDGIDGELARMKLLMSKQGEWFDSVGDDVIKMSMFVSLGHACSVIFEQPLFLLMTGIGLAWTIAMTSFWYAEVRRADSGTLLNVQWWWEKGEAPKKSLWHSFLVGMGYLLKRDTYTLLLVVLVIAGFPALSVSMMFVGINIIFFATFGQKLLAWWRQRPLLDEPEHARVS